MNPCQFAPDKGFLFFGSVLDSLPPLLILLLVKRASLQLQGDGQLLSAKGFIEVFLTLAFPMYPVAVNIDRHRDTVMAELLLNIGWADIAHQEQRCVRMPQIVRAPYSELGRMARTLHGVLNDPRCDTWKDKVNLFAFPQGFLAELFDVLFQPGCEEVGNIDQPLTRFRHIISLMSDRFGNHVLLVQDVEMIPAHGQAFTKSHAGIGQRLKDQGHRIGKMLPGGIEQSLQVGTGEWVRGTLVSLALRRQDLFQKTVARVRFDVATFNHLAENAAQNGIEYFA